jgi:serine/threonine protein kinase
MQVSTIRADILPCSLTIEADLHEANILFSLPSSIDNFDVGLLYEKYGQPELEHILRSDGQPLDPWIPTHGVVPAWLGCASDEITLADSRIFLIDFGESCRPPVDMRKSNTPFIYRAPEILLDPTAHVSFLAEIWSLACALFAIMGQRHLFETWLPTRDQIIEEHVDMLGHLPGEWQTSWAIHSQCFDDQLRRVDGEPRRPLEDRFEYSIQEPRREAGMLEMDNKEKEAFLDLLRSMLAVRPDCRPSAQHIVESRWVQKYAKPALELAKDSQQTCVQSAD